MCRITKLTRHEDGPRPFYTANLSTNGNTVAVTNTHGAWTSVEEHDGSRRFVRFEFAEKLSKKVKANERKLAKAVTA